MAQKTAVAMPDGEGERPRKPRLNYLQRAMAIQLREKHPDWTHEQLATSVGCSTKSIQRILQCHVSDLKAATQALLQTGVLERLDEWAKASKVAAGKGYYQAAEAWLQAAQAIDAKPTASVNVDARPTFVLNVPYKLGALKDYVSPEQPAIDAERVNELTPGQPEAHNPALEPSGSREPPS